MAEITIVVPGINDLAAGLIALANAIQIRAQAEADTEIVVDRPPAPVVEPKPEKITKTETNKTKPSIDLATLRAKFVEIAQSGNRHKELKTLLTEFGSDNVSGLTEDTWDEVYARLEAM
jgi:hypothetical protein